MNISWDQYFIGIACTVAKRSTCDRARVGAVLVRDRNIIATGYNGSPRGLAHCDDIGHLMRDDHCIRTVHAEQNAIIQAAVNGVSTVGSIMYVTHFPCLLCAKMTINARVARVVFQREYPDLEAKRFMENAGLEVSTPKLDKRY